MPKSCVVFVPPSKDCGEQEYSIYKASSSYDAARQAIKCHEELLKYERLDDDAELTIVVGGLDSRFPYYREHNSPHTTTQ